MHSLLRRYYTKISADGVYYSNEVEYSENNMHKHQNIRPYFYSWENISKVLLKANVILWCLKWLRLKTSRVVLPACLVVFLYF